MVPDLYGVVFFLVFACLCAAFCPVRLVSVDLMVHRHSSAAREARHARAVRRGYVRPLAPGARLLEVPAALSGQVKTMASSLAVHAKNDSVIGVKHHSARLSALAAFKCGAISDYELKRAVSLRRAADRAKHSPVSSMPDPVFLCDPWSAASRSVWCPASCTTAPSSRGAPTASPAALGLPERVKRADLESDDCDPDEIKHTGPVHGGGLCSVAMQTPPVPLGGDASSLTPPLSHPAVHVWDSPGSFLDSLDWEVPIAWSVAALADRLDQATLSLERLSAEVAAMPASTLRAAATLIKDAADALTGGLSNTIDTVFGTVSERLTGSILARLASVENLLGALRPGQRLLDLAARVDSLEKLLPNTSVRACGSRAPTRGRSSTPCRSLSQPSGSASSPPRGRRVLTPAPFPAQADLWEGSCPAPELRADPSGPGCVDPEGFEPFGDDIFVRTCGLQNQLFNGLVGKVLPGGRRNGRLPVHVFNIGEKKLFRPGNLVPYCPDQGDCCQVCHQRLNLYAFPCCSCPTCPTSEVAADAYG